MFWLSHLTLEGLDMQLLLAIHIKPDITFHRAGCPHESIAGVDVDMGILTQYRCLQSKDIA